MTGLLNKLFHRDPRPDAVPRPTPAPAPAAEEAQAGVPEGLAETFKADHERCDALWANVEDAADDPDALSAAFTAFDAAVRRHLAMEEDVIFPAFEDATGMHGAGPTAVMRSEHQQMRGLLDAMGRAAESGDADGVLDQGDTLLMLTQQHNLKEEQVLYPMAQGHLAPAWESLLARLGRY